ncbi:MAG: Phosphatidylserine decarboxylase, partial [uncultured Ramlibacter sp.]
VSTPVDPAAVPAAQEAAHAVCGQGRRASWWCSHPCPHPQVRRPLRGEHVGGGRPPDRKLRQLQRLLHPALEGRGPPALRRRAGVPGRRSDQPVRADRARPDLPGQGAQLLHHHAARRRRGAGAAVRPWAFRHAVPGAQGLPPHPHALRRAPGAHGVRAGRPVLGQSGHRPARAEPVRPQRARGLHLRDGVRAFRQRAGGCHHRRQRGHGLARRRQSAPHPRRSQLGLPGAGHRLSQGPGDGALPARLHRGDAVPEKCRDLRGRLGADAPGAAGRGDGHRGGARAPGL